MILKTITYTDFDGNERTETLYFHFSESELTDMELTTAGGLYGIIDEIIKTKDRIKLAKLFKTFILKAYGEKSSDGSHFRKSEKISEDFACTAAYDQLYLELAYDSEKLAAFIKGTLPKKIAALVEAEEKKRKVAAALDPAN